MENQKNYWIGLNLVKGIGAIRMRALLNAFGSAENAWKASIPDLEAAGLNPRLSDALVSLRASDRLEQVLLEIQKAEMTVLTWDDPEYPPRLLEIEQPPPVLYLRGQLSEADQWTVAVVGTRRITAYGRQITEEIGRELARSNVTVVSGLARGVDAVAHLAALNNSGRTLAVLGSGVDIIYPPENRQLAERIIQNGALISDYPPGAAPEAANFPPRNRIISGISQAVIIVEAGEKSGALITAAFAAEQGRHVFAVPGYLYAPQSKGTNSLIHAGAHIFLSVKDVLEILNLTQVGQYQAARSVLPADALEAQLYQLLGREALHVDEIRAQLDLPIEKVTGTLTLMELKGLVRQVGSMRYIAAQEESGIYSTEYSLDND